MKSILRPGHNCWRIERADRLAFLVDGAAYFRALRHALTQAEQSILILSWDIDSRFRMVRGEENTDDGWPVPLGEFLKALVSRKRTLHSHILSWDFAMIFALDRQWLPLYQRPWSTHRRLHFHMDDRHPMGGSHHQKVVVIDDKIAFAGGLDLTLGRWDTPEHMPSDPRRIELDNQPARPYHDAQVAVTGPAARALGHLARERWYCATGKKPRTPAATSDRDPWPVYLTADIVDVDVAIVRTVPEYDSNSEIREGERLYLDAIAGAERWIYIENQYFTSTTIADALAARLREDNGPEIVMVLPLRTEGWLANVTMDVIRLRLLQKLLKADHAHRLRVLYPDMPGLKEQPINVHTKLIVVDDDFVRVGSSNLNNRSMLLDTECDLAVEAAGDPRLNDAIAAFRDRLLGEHLGTDTRRVGLVMREKNSLIGTIAALSTSPRTLKPLEITEPANDVLASSDVFDPEYPYDPEVTLRRLVPEEQRQPLRRRLLMWSLLLILLLGLAAAWRWTPLSLWMHPEILADTFATLRSGPLALVAVMAVFVIAGLVVMPVMLLITATIISFGALHGFFYALAGSLLSAVVTYAIGRLIGRARVRRLAGSRLNRITQHLAQRGILTVFIVRLLPVAPFSVVNLVAGASNLSLRDFMLGTLLGMVPGIFVIALLVERIGAVLHTPSAGHILTLVGVALIVSIAIYQLVKWLRKSATQRGNKDTANHAVLPKLKSYPD
ncbi:MAG: VTT domain-containing protein [Pseudomonadota bacterium]|mgnify:CR=1 FL=1